MPCVLSTIRRENANVFKSYAILCDLSVTADKLINQLNANPSKARVCLSIIQLSSEIENKQI